MRYLIVLLQWMLKANMTEHKWRIVKSINKPRPVKSDNEDIYSRIDRESKKMSF
jgi:hypothetical protein